MDRHTSRRIAGASESGVAYHLLVGLVFAGVAPVAVAQAMLPKPRGTQHSAARPFATALDTARNTVAQAYSLPG